ncbi:MAG: MOSC domain-containing protein [Moorea sp. SIO4A3]|nr:MOSC domain-containing protein [Moorena sp. SIO4A3]
MKIAIPYLKAIYIYPIKSLDRIELETATLLKSGALNHDREFALFDQQGKFVNGKRHAKVHLLRSVFHIQSQLLSLQIQGTNQNITFHIDHGRTALEAWLKDYFDFPVKVVQNTSTGFPDDTNALGPTIISSATIETIASWFPQISVEDIRRRVRANLEIGGVPAFWEDQLFTESGKSIQFKVGEALIEGINPCQRCIVLARDPQTGEATDNFQKTFMAKRKETLPSWTTSARFNHFYKLSVNTNVPVSEAGKVLHQGDPIQILKVSQG